MGAAEEIVACVVVVGGIGGPVAAADMTWARMGATVQPRWACYRDSEPGHETGPRVGCVGATEEGEECSCLRSACGEVAAPGAVG